MAQNFLYMFEVVVDDLLVTRPNYCAPEEYPTCCEVSFRNSVFLSICDREFGQCVDPTAPKCGKCCLFSLDAPVTDSDKLLIHIYKKKTSKCKFLVGCTDMPIKFLFDKVMENFNIENQNWEEVMKRHLRSIPNPNEPNKPAEIIDNDCDEDTAGRREQLCPTSELTKRLLPLFNLKGCQTGNIVLIIRLVANGPAIVSSFPFARLCNAGCGAKPPSCNSASQPKSNAKQSCPGTDDILPNMGRCCGGNDSQFGAGSSPGKCDPSYGNEVQTSKPGCSGKAYRNHRNPSNGCLPLPDPCHKEVKKPVCQRYFACNADKGCACENVEDDCERLKQKQRSCAPPKCGYSEPPKPCNTNYQNQPCSCDECVDECEADSADDACDPCKVNGDDDECDPCMRRCFIEPTKPEPGPDAYEEFEACLNGSGLVIRVLKDSHQVQNVYDGTENMADQDSGSECDIQNEKNSMNHYSMTDLAQTSIFARNHIKRRTGGHIINHPGLPKIRANIKYSGNDACCPSSYHIPYSKVKQFYDNQDFKVDSYRRRRNYKTIYQPMHPGDNRNCCIQVDRDDIKNALKGINVDTRKKGIEVCYRTCDDTDSDIFLVKLGSKQKCQNKKNKIEIELKTPKQPLILPKQKVTTETQINEAELDAALSGICKKGKKKGKGKKKK